MTTCSKKAERLSASAYELAQRGLSGEYGRAMVEAGISLDDFPETSNMSGSMRYAFTSKLIAQNAPIRLVAGELLAGSATYVESTGHMVPVMGISSTSHHTPGFGRVLTEGYKGIRQRISDRLSRNIDDQGRDFLDAMLLCLDAADIWHSRYVDALDAAIAASDGAEKACYMRTRAALENVPQNPPQNFHEAVQSLWFAYDFQRLLGNWPGIGRIDYMLGPYLENDLKTGAITIDEAREILAHFWIKGTEWIGAPTWSSGDAQYYQNIVLSGVDSDGNDITNEVTYLVLDIAEELKISDFPIAVRIGAKTDKRLLNRIAEVWQAGANFVSVYNDDIVIKAMTDFGYPEHVAREFANDGCWEPLIPGQTAFIYYAVDMLSCIQDALGLDGECNSSVDYPDFDSLYKAVRDKLEALIIRSRDESKNIFNNDMPAVALSMIIDDCIENGRGYHDRGARYNVQALHVGGLQDTANSLYAIKKLVYDEKKISLPELVDILKSDWTGNDVVRLKIRKDLDFYGNDNDECDDMVRRVFDDYTDIMAKNKCIGDLLTPAGISTFGREIEWAGHRNATAAGTCAGDILACNFSPAPGTDTKGPLAVLKSYCKMDFTRLPNCGTLELKILPSSVRGENGIAALTGLLRSFVLLGGMYMNIDVVDTKTLLDAREHPENYPNLSVRVSGWNSRFVTMGKEWQDMIIQRTQQEF